MNNIDFKKYKAKLIAIRAKTHEIVLENEGVSNWVKDYNICEYIYPLVKGEVRTEFKFCTEEELFKSLDIALEINNTINNIISIDIELKYITELANEYMNTNDTVSFSEALTGICKDIKYLELCAKRKELGDELLEKERLDFIKIENNVENTIWNVGLYNEVEW